MIEKGRKGRMSTGEGEGRRSEKREKHEGKGGRIDIVRRGFSRPEGKNLRLGFIAISYHLFSFHEKYQQFGLDHTRFCER